MFSSRSRLTLFISIIAVLLVLSAGSAVVIAQRDKGELSPDVPGLEHDEDNDADYVALREEAVARLRGVVPDKPFDIGKRNAAVARLKIQLQHPSSAGPSTASVSGTTWAPVGPAPIPNGQTTNTTNPVSGRVTAIAIHPTNPNIAYLGTAQGGLFRTLDGGTTWTALMDDAESLAIGAVTIDPVDPTIVYVGTGEGNLSLDSYFGVGLYRITNADTSPTVSGPFETRVAGTGTGIGNTHAFKGTSITRIVVDPSNDNRIFIGNTYGHSGVGDQNICCGGTNPTSAEIGLYFSANAKAMNPSFSRVSGLPGGGIGGVSEVAFEPGSSDKLFVGVQDYSGTGGDGLYRTINASSASQSPSVSPSFTRVLTPGNGGNIKVAINKVGSVVTVYAATEDNNGTLKVSTDGGVTFSSALGAATGFCSGQCWYDIGLAVDPTNASNVYIGGATKEFLKSTNGGSSFAESDTRLHADVHAIAIAPSNSSIIYEGNDGGVWKSTDSGSTWIDLNNSGLNTVQFESVAAHPTSSSFIIGGTQDNGTNLRDGTGTWRRADWGDGGFAQIDQNATNTTSVTMYHTYYNQSNSQVGYAVATSPASAGDGNWPFRGCLGNSTRNGIICSDPVLFYAPLALGPGTPNTVYFGTSRLYRSTDTGVNNVQVSQNFTKRITAIGISAQDDNVRIVGLEDGRVFVTTTGSSTMTEITGSIPGGYVSRAVIDPQNNNVAYVTLDDYGLGAGQHVWKTTNLKSATPTWTAAGSGIPDVPVNAFVVDPANSNVLYAGTDIGVYVSNDAGSSWNVLGSGLPVVSVFDMAVQPTGRVLYVATHGRGIWEIASAQPSVSVSTAELDFGNQPVNTTSSPQTVRLTNSGNASLSLSAVKITGETGEFAIGSTHTCGSQLAPTEHCDTSVVFTPTTAADHSAQLQFVDGSNQVVESVTLTGTGTTESSNQNQVVAGNAREPAIAQDPSNPSILAVSVIDTSGSTTQCGVSLSTDGGASWSVLDDLPSPQPSTFDSGIDPSVAFDGSGNLYASCTLFNASGLVTPSTGSQVLNTGVYVYRGEVNGNSISWAASPTSLASARRSTLYLFGKSILTTGSSVDKSYLAADPNVADVYASFTQEQMWGWIGRKQIEMASSTNGGQSFVTVPVDSAFGGGSSAIFANTSSSMPVVASDGSIDVAWLLGTRLALSHSSDHGAHWSKRQDVETLTPLTAPNPNPFSFTPNSFPSLAVDPGNAAHVYLVWADNRSLNPSDTSGDVNVLLAQCTFDTTFACGTPAPVGDDESSPSVDTDQLDPAVSVAPNGDVAILYYQRTDTGTDGANVVVAISTDGGQTFSPVNVTDSAITLGNPGAYAGMVMDNSGGYVVWSASNGGTQTVFFSPLAP